MHSWQAHKYHHNSSVQYLAAKALIQLINISESHCILDVGCGDGKITAEIAKYASKGSVLGIDISSEMIDYANNMHTKYHKNLNFILKDAQELSYKNLFDLVFSSFAIQWFSNPSLFFNSVLKSLNSNGFFAATIPLGISGALEESINIITAKSEWSLFFQNFNPHWNFLTQKDYSLLLKDSNFKLKHFETVIQEFTFLTRKSFEDYVLQWFSYLYVLPQNLKTIFFQEIIDKYLELNPKRLNEQIIFKFPRLEFVAKAHL